MPSFINLGRKIIFFKLLQRHCDLKGHLRSKVKVPNESPVMTSYLKLIVLYAYLVPFSRYWQF